MLSGDVSLGAGNVAAAKGRLLVGVAANGGDAQGGRSAQAKISRPRGGDRDGSDGLGDERSIPGGGRSGKGNAARAGDDAAPGEAGGSDLPSRAFGVELPRNRRATWDVQHRGGDVDPSWQAAAARIAGSIAGSEVRR